MKSRICINCEHFSISFGSDSYSEYTPGIAGDATCERGLWRITPDDSPTVDRFRLAILRAEECELFEEYSE